MKTMQDIYSAFTLRASKRIPLSVHKHTAIHAVDNHTHTKCFCVNKWILSFFLSLSPFLLCPYRLVCRSAPWQYWIFCWSWLHSMLNECESKETNEKQQKREDRLKHAQKTSHSFSINKLLEMTKNEKKKKNKWTVRRWDVDECQRNETDEANKANSKLRSSRLTLFSVASLVVLCVQNENAE